MAEVTFHAARPASELEIKRFERRHSIRIPEPYAEFLRDHGGGSPEPDWFEDTNRGIGIYVARLFPLELDRMAQQLFGFPDPNHCGLLTIGTNGGGNYFLLSLRSGEVYYWNHEEDDDDLNSSHLLWLAPSFTAFVQALVPQSAEPE